MANLNIRIDAEIKAQAQRLFAEYGLDLTTAINLFLRQAIREQGYTFDLHKYTPNGALLDALTDVKSGRINGPYKTAEDAMASILEGDDEGC